MQKAMSEEVKVTLGDFLELYKDGNACVSIYVDGHFLFEEENYQDVMKSNIYNRYKDELVERFNIIGGYCDYPVELTIFLK